MNVNLICFQENLSLKLSLCVRQLQPKEETQPWDCGHAGLPRPPGRNGGKSFPRVCRGAPELSCGHRCSHESGETR